MKISLLLLLLLLGRASGAAEPTQQLEVDVTAPVVVWDVSDPSVCRYCEREPPVVTDGNRLKTLSGVGPNGEFAIHLAEGNTTERSLAGVISGGKLTLHFDASNNKIAAVVIYRSARNLDAQELSTVAEYTRRELLDGLGRKFAQHHARLTGLFVEFDVSDPNSTNAAMKF